MPFSRSAIGSHCMQNRRALLTPDHFRALIPREQAVFFCLFSLLSRKHPWMVLSYGIFAVSSFRRELRRLGQHLSCLWSRWQFTFGGLWNLLKPETWVAFVPPPLSSAAYPDAVDLLKARLYHVSGFHLLSWTLLAVHFGFIAYVFPVVTGLRSVLNFCAPELGVTIREGAFRLLFRSPVTPNRSAPPRILNHSRPGVGPREGPVVAAPLALTAALPGPVGGELVQQAQRAVFAADAELKRARAEEAAASALCGAAAVKLSQAEKSAAAAERMVARARVRDTLLLGRDPAVYVWHDDDACGEAGQSAAVTEAEAQRGKFEAEAGASAARARALRASAAVLSAEAAVRDARVAYETFELAHQATLPALVVGSSAVAKEAEQLERVLENAVRACEGPVRLVEEARLAYIAATAQMLVARDALEATRAPSALADRLEPVAAWARSAEGRAQKHAVERAVEAQERAGGKLEAAVRRLADSMEAVTEADARLAGMRDPEEILYGLSAHQRAPSLANAESRQKQKQQEYIRATEAGAGGWSVWPPRRPGWKLRDAKREQAKARRELERVLARVRGPLVSVAKAEAEYASAQALASDAL